MAKAAEIEVAPEEPYALAAARIVRVRADELFAQAEGVLDTEDIERVHDMRVASRRLRAVLEVFAPCFPRGPYKGVLRDVKRIADALGERRDPDVHRAAREKRAAKLPPELRPGVELLADRQRARQADGNDVLAPALEDMQRTELQARLHALADAAEAASAWRRGRPRRRSREGADVQGARAGRDARRQRRADRPHPPGRGVLLHAQGRGPGRSYRASRHAHRGQAPPLRSGDHA